MLVAGNPPQALDSCSLTPELYKTALDVLSKSRVTHQVRPSGLRTTLHSTRTLFTSDQAEACHDQLQLALRCTHFDLCKHTKRLGNEQNMFQS